MAKVQHWPSVFNDIIFSRLHTPFAWGSNDCCLFASDVVKATTGADPAFKLRGKYTGALGAKRVIKKFSRNLEGLVVKLAKQHGMIEVHPNKAQRCNIVLGDTPDHGPSVGVCVGATVAFTGPSGLNFLPLTACRRAWHF